jgi:hypothetical protein
LLLLFSLFGLRKKKRAQKDPNPKYQLSQIYIFLLIIYVYKFSMNTFCWLQMTLSLGYPLLNICFWCVVVCRFAFPALKPPQPFQQRSAEPLAAAYPQQQLQQQICATADAWRAAAAAVNGGGSNSSVGPGMLCLMQVNRATSNVQTAPLANWHEFKPQSQQQSSSSAAAGSDAHSNVQQQQQQGDEELLLVMFDPCHLPLTPGWPLRNVLLLAAARWGVRQLRVLCVRDSSAGRAAAERSYVLQVRLAWCCGLLSQLLVWTCLFALV